jgi:hypothetical protein
MRGDWRDFRPAIWLAMLGIALILVLNPPYIGAAMLGAAIGIALKITRRRRTPVKSPEQRAPGESRRRRR